MQYRDEKILTSDLWNHRNVRPAAHVAKTKVQAIDDKTDIGRLAERRPLLSLRVGHR
jgi:hypothetical protein